MPNLLGISQEQQDGDQNDQNESTHTDDVYADATIEKDGVIHTIVLVMIFHAEVSVDIIVSNHLDRFFFKLCKSIKASEKVC